MNDTPHSHPQLADAVERVKPSVVAVRCRRVGTASAFAWRANVLVTAANAVGHASRVQLVLPSGEAVAGEVRGIDPATDLAVVGSDATVPVVERRMASGPRVGDFVFAVGREASSLLHASFGHIGAVAGAWRAWRGGQVDRLIRLDGGLYPAHVAAASRAAPGPGHGRFPWPPPARPKLRCRHRFRSRRSKCR
ncbi:hypothetical protein GCM10028796_22270 [Ramlibacter monticola]|uniref:Serine protease n=1 Tax=Ramlibacter monticola TaxID=1926872 RepID=A0A937CUA2_9BURK|nr:S1C family serine protease [Ramlibacter monticola]MBL0392478.1 serine protease [Ramlibacter monticola]